MTAYNANFELSVEDVDLIETALRQSKKELSSQMIGADNTDVVPGDDGTLRQIHDLLGRLHNQKVFYRPRRQAYVGG
ncbi:MULTISPECIES: hypothetical protein [unclassified Roseovarius]|uniref:hypothetical protein n=1 Tax=unclassified Roseovarius TaxID=2614913 RepID=UPI00273D01D8|nr:MULTISPECIES: hypothetical protein [unclassified Roseovarius]